MSGDCVHGMLPRTTSELQNLSSQTGTVDGNIPIRHSRNLPYKLWVVIAKSLGIKLQDCEKPIISTLFYVLTYLAFFGNLNGGMVLQVEKFQMQINILNIDICSS
ncbi:hypothetical protein Avbf_16890 [Armadillidium vulgare]|nr:hypothetical protein Avbf_16890 [Armadillidium vulgare]